MTLLDFPFGDMTVPAETRELLVRRGLFDTIIPARVLRQILERELLGPNRLTMFLPVKEPE